MKTDIKGSGMRSYLEIDCSNLWENGRMDSSRKISFVVTKLVFWERMVSLNWAVGERSQSLHLFYAEDVDWFHQGGGFRGDTGSFQAWPLKSILREPIWISKSLLSLMPSAKRTDSLFETAWISCPSVQNTVGAEFSAWMQWCTWSQERSDRMCRRGRCLREARLSLKVV